MSPSKDAPFGDSANPPRIAIKGFSLSAKTSSKPLSISARSSPSTTLGKRPRAALHYNDSDDEDERPVKHEMVTGFDSGNAITKETRVQKEILVIPKMKNKDWRKELRQKRGSGKNLLPPEVQARMRGENTAKPVVDTKDVINTEADMPKWGLSVKEKVDLEGSTVPVDVTSTKNEVVEENDVQAPREKTEDEMAMDALMGVKNDKKGPDLIIPVGLAEAQRSTSEEDAYRKAIREAPDVSTLEDYERVPVEDFGAALLRGMGWKEGDGKKGQVDRPKEVTRRPNRLGLGARELKNPEELGAWVQNSRRRPTDRRPKANEYREKQERKREDRDERYGSHRRDRERDDYRGGDRDKGRDRRR